MSIELISRGVYVYQKTYELGWDNPNLKGAGWGIDYLVEQEIEHPEDGREEHKIFLAARLGFNKPESEMTEKEFEMVEQTYRVMADLIWKTRRGEITYNRHLGRPYINKWREPDIYECHCGKSIEIYGETNCPYCGRLYNGSGQELRKDWQEHKDDDGVYEPEIGERW